MQTDQLQRGRAHMESQLSWLEHSFDTAQKIGLKEFYSVHEFDVYENLCTRFGRLNALLHKMLRLLDVAEAGEQKPFGNKERVRQIDALSRRIAETEVDDALQALFEEVLELTPELIGSAEKTLHYSDRFAR